MFGNVVMDIDGALFEHELEAIKKAKNVETQLNRAKITKPIIN